MLKVEIILKLIKKSHYKRPYLDNFDKRYLNDSYKNSKISNIRYIISINNFVISECIIFI